MSTGWNAYRTKGTIPQADKIRKLGLLIVDDEQGIVESLREVFGGTFEIQHSTSATEALELFKEHTPKLVISDQRMPGMTGLELLRRVKEIQPSTISILVTGYSDINIVVEALNEGLLWKYVAKPWDHDKLRELVLQGARKYIKDAGLDEKAYGMQGFFGA
ncbi:MAG: response regulator [Deltaproteobacteria bacterium]|nr:response regulator [Deltaproteobacteria bacterium]